MAVNPLTGAEVVIDSGPTGGFYSMVKNPDIDGDLIVYESNLSGNLEIQLYRLSDGTSFQVTSNPTNQQLSSIFGNKVAYVDDRIGVDDINLSTLTINVGAGDSTAVAGGLIVSVLVSDTLAYAGEDSSLLEEGVDPVVGSAVINADGSLLISADSTTRMDARAGSGALSLNAESVGASVVVVVDIDNTLAFLGENVDATALGMGAALDVNDGVYVPNGDKLEQGTESRNGIMLSATSLAEHYHLAIGASSDSSSSHLKNATCFS